jgi:hypothetical protein
VQELVDAFVDEQEGSQPGRAAAIGVGDGERWADYQRLQLYDRFSLYFCVRDVEAGEPSEILDYRFQPLGPWHVRVDPYPFADSPMQFSLVRRLVPKERGEPHGLLAIEPERVEIAIER